MTQPSLLDLAPRFDGATFDHATDDARTRKHLARVLALLADGQPHTAEQIAESVGCQPAAAGARARDLRKLKVGAHDIRCERIAGGLWAYRLVREAT